jgi:hypothetical protein
LPGNQRSGALSGGLSKSVAWLKVLIAALSPVNTTSYDSLADKDIEIFIRMQVSASPGHDGGRLLPNSCLAFSAVCQPLTSSRSAAELIALSNPERIEQKRRKHPRRRQAKHKHRARRAILGDTDCIVALRMQMVERRLERGVEQLGGQDHAAHDREKGPPHHSRAAPRQHRKDAERGEALQAKARFVAPCGNDASDGESESMVEALIFHAVDSLRGQKSQVTVKG